eukprot:TRINITY_DN951_c0_g1_i4.p1 TRINITY_DN951_c0_g1~~TRINITY_DN951_c0_g1_i4.p1  ORF type:complete len:1177 (+),score=271.60 TRINITY_DN951_c0_g1_i4:42-3572(+)
MYHFNDNHCPVSPKVFNAISTVDVDTILSSSDAELRPVLSCLVRMSLIAPMDQSQASVVLQVLSRIELVNSIVALLSIDFHSLEQDVKKEQQLKLKTGGSSTESILISNLTSGPALEFERSDPTRKLRLVLSELMCLMAKDDLQDKSQRPSELFDHKVYLNEVCDVLAIALAELPALLQPKDVCEALLCVKYGPDIICHIVANQTDSYLDVVHHLLENGGGLDDEVEEDSARQDALLLLARMCPAQALGIRARCVDQGVMPGLAILLSLEHAKTEDSDLVEFITGLLLGGTNQNKSWISQYLRSSQKRSSAPLDLLRHELTQHVAHIINECPERSLPGHLVLESTNLLKLFSALRGIAGLKFCDDEVNLLVELITRHPPPTPAGVKLVSLGLCMLIAFNSLVSTPGLEKQALDWIRTLVHEEKYFQSASACGGSFGEMLLLIAINFHAGQLNAIGDLVSTTMGFKITVRTNNLTRMKQMFTNDIFPESVVAGHAVRVPVTRNLSGDLTGFLPVHCMHQLLKSRVFSKHKVSIKSWIYEQICCAASPLHPVLPALIEAYVHSILIPPSHRNVGMDQLNEPLTEQEIRRVFSKVIIDRVPDMDDPCSTPVMPHATSRRRLSAAAAKSGGRRRESGLFSPPKYQDRLKHERTPEDELCTQICLLYYILLYEDLRLTNMKSLATTGKKVLKYSSDLLAELPVKFLLSEAESRQDRLEGMFSSLLRLCVTQFPHLCLVEDWIGSEGKPTSLKKCSLKSRLTPRMLKKCLENAEKCPAKAVFVLQQMQSLSGSACWELVDPFISSIQSIARGQVARQVQELYRMVWMQLNAVYPRKLWLFTVNNLNPQESVAACDLNQEELSLDPLSVLRCDPAVFRSGSILSIVLYMLKACLAASRTRLNQHLQEQPTAEVGQTPDMEKEELKNALVLTQESAAIQILLECCVQRESDLSPSQRDKESLGDKSLLSNLQEVQSLVCSYLHQAFITDPNLAKLVHFQGYPTELLQVTVKGVPSMHICLDFAPELLSQPSLEKQIFAIDLISHLSLEYPVPRSLSTARLAVNSISTLLSVLDAVAREELILSSLQPLHRICIAFPPLMEDVISLLLQAGQMCLNSSTLSGYTAPSYSTAVLPPRPPSSSPHNSTDLDKEMDRLHVSQDPVCALIVQTFRNIIHSTVLSKSIFA